MVSLEQSILLAVIQGITEWLPISSSGHLVLFQKLLNVNVPVLFDVALHLGTIIPVIIIFRKDILEILQSFFSFDRKNANFKLGLLVIVGTSITGLIGYSFLHIFESFFTNLFVVGVGFFISGFILLSTKLSKRHRELNLLETVLIGIAQAIAIIPGISRSGSTIGTALIRGIDKKQAIKFSFLLSVPIIIAANLVEVKDIDIFYTDPIPFIIGIVTSVVVGYLSIKFLIKTILDKKFHLFSIYCFILGAVVLFLTLS